MTGVDTRGLAVLHPTIETSIGEKNPAPGSILFDLVAIHGLNGDAIATWTHKETGVMWLRDLLPEALPNIRIMTYGYNARFKNFTAQQDMRSICSKLLTELVDLRPTEEEKHRPIIFVCHSLGGIVAKKALLMGCSEEEEQVQKSVYGILFLGTPHNGSSLASMGKLVANILSACSPIRPPLNLLGTLRKDSEVLLEITQDFIKRRKELHLVSFYELEFTSIGPFLKKLIVEQQSAILHVPNEIIIPQFADHRNIVRFRSHQDRAFRPVMSRLKHLARELQRGSIGQTQPGPESVHSIPFDVPILPCLYFRGRDGVLDIMKDYFHGHQAQGPARRSFALCGLRGSGASQTALHYILQNMSRYSTGVMWLNATSTMSLEADFDRLHDLLKLGDSENKINSVKSWLSRHENAQWILVFDNADDMESVHIDKYLPSVNWGHVLITSCDQAVIGNIADKGHVLAALVTEDATHLLLESSGIEQPTQRETEQAGEIANLLGSLPLALVQAGAFMRSRRKSLKEYQDLYVTRRNDLLRFSPRLGFTDKAVLTAWEINFKQVEQDSPAATSLLLLFSFLEPSSIPELVLHRGSSPQKRWGRNGEVTEISAQDEGVDRYLTEVIQGDLEFDQAVEKLLSFSLISCNKVSNGLRKFSIHPLVQYCATQRLSLSETSRWRWQAILLICHAFPRNAYIEPESGKVGRLLLPHLNHVLSEYDALCVNHGRELVYFRHELASTLLAACRFSHAQWKLEAISRTKTLLKGDNDPFLNAWLAYRESSIKRISGMSRESDHVLERFLRQSATPGQAYLDVTARFNAQKGNLIISFAENLIREGKLTAAKEELVEWKSLGTEHSTFERIVSRARDITLGKVLRYQGMFGEALTLLERVLQDSLLDDYFEGTDWYRVLVSGVADLYCEVGRPTDAETLVLKELTPLRESGMQDIATGRRLQMSLAESHLQRNMYGEAEPLLLDVHRAVTSSGTPSYKAQVNNFRIWVSLARISHVQSHWEVALSRWKHALSILDRLGLNGGLNAGIVRYSVAHALLMTGHELECTEMLEEARTNMASEPRLFWIPMFNSQWHDFITDSLKFRSELENK